MASRRKSLHQSKHGGVVYNDENDDAAELEMLKSRRKSGAGTPLRDLNTSRVDLLNVSMVNLSKLNATKNVSFVDESLLEAPPTTVNREKRRRSIFPRKAAALKPVLTNEQLTGLYSNCIKMSAENKITQKNTWDLNLIDYIDHVLHEDKSAAKLNFQRASCTIDASVKIYSTRVDSVHQDTYKVLGGLSRTGQEEDGAIDGDAPSQRRPRSKKAAATLETNFDAISVKKIDLEFEVDPLFRKTSAAFDEGGTRGMLLNHVGVSYGAEVVFDSADAVNTKNTASAQASSACSVASLRGVVPSNWKERGICPGFSSFLDAWDTPIQDEDSGWDVSLDSPALNTSVMMGGDNNVMDANMLFGDEDIQEQEFHNEEQNLMDDIHDGGDDDHSDSEFVVAHARQVQKLVPLTAATSSEFSYFDPKLIQNWTGPDHWKYTAHNKKKKDDTRTKKKKKEKFQIDFSTTHDATFAKGTKASLLLAKNTLARMNASDANNLPTDHHYDPEALATFFLKPKYKIQTHQEMKMKANTSMNASGFGEHTAAFALDDSDDDFGGPCDVESDWASGPTDVSEADASTLALIAEPEKAQKIEIGYARVAKRVNVRMLKKGMWQGIRRTKDADKEVKIDNRNFQDVLNELPATLPPQQMEAVSVPFCFMALLHLANEHELSIQGDASLHNLIISQG